MLYLLCASLCVLVSACTSHRQIAIAPFSQAGLSQWREQVFKGHTEYDLVVEQGETVLQAKSLKSASALYHRINIDLEKTPFLNWRWKVTRTLGDLDEKTKAGDDYPARLYVILPGRGFELRPRSLNYVWSNTSTLNSHWPNAYSDKVVMLAVQSGDKNLKQWQMQKRNVLEDIQTYFGESITKIIGLAIMTDTDNSQTNALSYYGDIYFSKK